ncbi:protease modulator HflC [Leadbettera azotonutricia]|uniref:Protein HflC n=1 Tax=Leadbettera azotonutricia (strain ATCC BAA-888 / DSM 13862 / ZAS-9) TaxID=545695 RepID=F5YEY9_LEAAZ|nr:protease modulator HflC [Leadbettera azotonutricia]AEF81631.1 HflC protein [Leadbettera azotonutricia ZAS-9]
MKKFFTFIIVLAIIVIAVLIMGPFYVVDEGELAVIVQMGRLTDVITEAGLHIKVPFIDDVVRYPKRIMAWDGEQKSMPTREKQYIWVDVTARWRISDPKKFYESIKTIDAAYQKLAEVIDSEVRTVTAENYLRESVRNSNMILEQLQNSEAAASEGENILTPQVIESEGTREPILRGRRQLAEEILARSRRMVPEYGIELIDVVTRQIRYNDELTQSVYARMIKERNQIAQYRRSEGEGKKAEWMGRMSNERMSILSDAYAKAEAIRGAADADASRTYAEAYNRDRDFFDFWRAVESYRTTLPNFDKTLSTNMDYFRYLYSPRGR